MGVDNAKQLLESSDGGKRISVDAFTKVMQQLETTLEIVTAAELAEGSPVGAVAEQLISNLKVNPFCILYMHTHL